jgi:hypothetical protein
MTARGAVELAVGRSPAVFVCDPAQPAIETTAISAASTEIAGRMDMMVMVSPGTTPTDPAALTFLTMTTRPSLRADYKPGEGGRTNVDMLRWVQTQGEYGPWPELVTAADAGRRAMVAA